MQEATYSMFLFQRAVATGFFFAFCSLAGHIDLFFGCGGVLDLGSAETDLFGGDKSIQRDFAGLLVFGCLLTSLMLVVG